MSFALWARLNVLGGRVFASCGARPTSVVAACGPRPISTLEGCGPRPASTIEACDPEPVPVDFDAWAHYVMDEEGGAVAEDSSGNNRDGVFGGRASFGYLDDRNLPAIKLAGGEGTLDLGLNVDDYQVGSYGGAAPTFEDAFSLTFRAKPISTAEMPAALGSNLDPTFTGLAIDTGWLLFPEHGGRGALFLTGYEGVGFNLGTNGLSVYAYAHAYVPCMLIFTADLSAWHDYALVFNGHQGHAGTDVTLYIDGAAAAVFPGATLLQQVSFYTPFMSPRWDMALGWGSAYDGYLRNVRIFDRALTAEEVAAIYASEVPVPPPWAACGDRPESVFVQDWTRG